MVDPKKIIEKHSLGIEKIIRETDAKVLYLLTDKNGSKFILKFYKYNNSDLRTEKRLLSRVKLLKCSYITFPRLIDSGKNFILEDYIERELWTRDTILEKDWTADDIELWVSGLREFQNINLPGRLFSIKQRLMGLIYPVYRIFILTLKCRRLINLRAFGTILKLTFNYTLHRLFLKNALTHYDLQTTNYTFMKNEYKMSMIDFELPYFGGDPLFDVLYYISIPTKTLADWTFQKEIFREYIKQEYENKYDSKSLMNRTRLILLVCNLSRYLSFINDAEKNTIYSENINLLLNGESFNRWYSFISNPASFCLSEAR